MKNVKLFLINVLILFSIFQMRGAVAVDSTALAPIHACQSSFITSFVHPSVASNDNWPSATWSLPAGLIIADINHGGTLCPGTYKVSIRCENFFTNGNCSGSCNWFGKTMGSCGWYIQGQDASNTMVVQGQIINGGGTGSNSAPQCEHGNPNPNTTNFSMWALSAPTWDTTASPNQITQIYMQLESGGAQSGPCSITVTP